MGRLVKWFLRKMFPKEHKKVLFMDCYHHCVLVKMHVNVDLDNLRLIEARDPDIRRRGGSLPWILRQGFVKHEILRRGYCGSFDSTDYDEKYVLTGITNT